jgi:hypothetical protein
VTSSDLIQKFSALCKEDKDRVKEIILGCHAEEKKEVMKLNCDEITILKLNNKLLRHLKLVPSDRIRLVQEPGQLYTVQDKRAI